MTIDQYKIANGFNKFFKEIDMKLTSSIPHTLKNFEKLVTTP